MSDNSGSAPARRAAVARHFDRWLELFEQSAREICPADAADHFIMLAHRIAESLELGVAGANGVLLRKGERFVAD